MSTPPAMAIRVLIAEDEPSIAISLEFLMRGCGYETLLAVDGAEVIAAMAGFRPDLVLLDVMLPSVSGLDLSRAIRSDPRFGLAKVLMLTARGGASEVDRGLAAGADDYVVKPFSTHDLVARVRALLGSRAPGEAQAAGDEAKP